ncbi:catechol 2,3-dioxygenase [Cytobacillus eiseniae]|uniref:Catechol 2,3-dioxygenase n=1 Tax=Cytobacillus eiseniae TaxID=762947 RepID=A0ABS4RII7_9BACI|nr:VOC family protein [Cytobacillus eiseniae]MBP2242216.1 catechol 2,3-dioxygenase [Cytobacillus eiseniae]
MNFHSEPNVFVRQVDIKVADLERAIAFYQQVIGFQILEKQERKAVLTADGKTPLLQIEQPEEVVSKQPRTTGLYHFALLLPTRSDLAKIIEHFIKNGYPLQGASDHLVSEALYLADPDGNGIEIYTDRPAESWVWNNGEVHMTTERLDIESILAEGDGTPWSGLPAKTVMGHIHLHVADLHAAEQFYCQGLGFEVVTRYGGQALFISSGGYHHHIGLNTWNGLGAPAPVENSVGLASYTLIFPNEEAREMVIERLKRIEVPVSKKDHSYLAKDPSGNLIVLSV